MPGLGNMDKEVYVQVDELQHHGCAVVGRWRVIEEAAAGGRGGGRLALASRKAERLGTGSGGDDEQGRSL